MNRIQIILSFVFFIIIFFSCSSDKKVESEDIVLRQNTENKEGFNLKGDNNFPEIKTRPSTVLLTGHQNYRLVTLYKEKFNKHNNRKYIDGNYFHRSYNDYFDNTNAWHNHFMPGIEAVYGFNMLNIAHYNIKEKKKNYFFKNHVIIKTLYYPSFISDTLNNKPIKRNYYMVSVYNEDTNNDSIINSNDLRRFFLFDIEGTGKIPMIPLNYSVLSSEYDSGNDIMYIFAIHDENSNGSGNKDEPIHVFLIDLKSPKLADRLY